MESHSRDVPVGALSHGAHAALIYSSRDEQSDVLKSFVEDALNANDRLLYVGDREHGERALKAYGRSGARALASGRFVIEDSSATYMAGGRFDSRRMLLHYGTALESALAEGYGGLRVAAEMGWAVRGLTSKDDLVRYERVLDRALSARPAVVLCQYERRAYDEDVLAALSKAHAHSARPDPLHESTQLHIARTYDPHGVQASGEIDISTRMAFRDALLRVTEPSEHPLVVDLSRITYVDAGGVGAIVNAASRARQKSVTVRIPKSLRKMFETLHPTLPRTVHVEEVE